MSKIWKYLAAVALLFVGLAAFAQEKNLSYYSSHENEVWPDAQAAFSSGNYERAKVLCDWYYILLNDDKAEALREKSSRCAVLLREINELAASGQIDEAERKLESLREFHPEAQVDLTPFMVSRTLERIDIVNKFLTLPENDMETLRVEYFPKGLASRGRIQWTSSAPEIVSVDSYGNVRTHGAGEATITAVVDDLSAACVVSVVKLSLSRKQILLCAGEKTSITLETWVDNLDWSVADPAIVEIQVVDDRVDLYARRAGKTTLTASKGLNKVTCQVEVEELMVDLGLPSGILWASHNIGATNKTEGGESLGLQDVFFSSTNIAEMRMGQRWDIPRPIDYQELMNNCRWEYVTVNDRSGVLFTSRINGKSLFFPVERYNYGAYHTAGSRESFTIYMWETCGLEITGIGDLVRPVYRVSNSEVRIGDVFYSASYLEDDDKCEARSITYLTPYLDHFFSTSDRKVRFDVKLVDPYGQLLTGSESPEGYTYSYSVDVARGYSSRDLPGWGNNDGGTYEPGEYTIEIWIDEQCLYTTKFKLYEQGSGLLKRAYENSSMPWALADVKPSFNGAEEGVIGEFRKWVNSNLVYPEIAKENGVQGEVRLAFTVAADGRVKKVRVVRGVDESLDMEAMRVVSSSPKWKPGEVDGQAVDVEYPSFRIVFQLR